MQRKLNEIILQVVYYANAPEWPETVFIFAAASVVTEMASNTATASKDKSNKANYNDADD